MPKLSKGERRNQFLMNGAQRRADQRVRGYLSKTPITGLGELANPTFEKAMDAIVKAMTHMYVAGINDALDTEDGKTLSEIPE